MGHINKIVKVKCQQETATGITRTDVAVSFYGLSKSKASQYAMLISASVLS